MAIIDIEHVTKAYPAHPGTRVLLGRGGLATLLSRHYTPETATGLSDMTLSIDLGECVGIAGPCGAGKTTLLKLIAGITTPTAGKLTVLGRVAAVMDAHGLDHRLTGRENVLLQARFHGLTRKEAAVIVDTVAEFAGLGGAIDRPVASYSSGKRTRLAFGIAVHTSPDVVLIDDVVTMSDAAFREVCRAATRKLREQGKTVVLVLDAGASEFRELCDRVVFLEDGKVVPETRSAPTDTEVAQAPTPQTIVDGAMMITFEQGRLAISRAGEDLTAPEGGQTDLLVNGRHARGVDAVWTIAETSENHLLVLGNLPETPATLEWRLDLQKDRVVWNIALFCDEVVVPESLEMQIALPARFTRWSSGDQTGELGEAETTIPFAGSSDSEAVQALLLDGSGDAARLEASTPVSDAALAAHARVNHDEVALRVVTDWKDDAEPLAEGRHDILSVHLDFLADSEPSEASSDARRQAEGAAAPEPELELDSE